MDLLPINTSMSRFDQRIQTHADSKDGSRLQTEIADLWQSIRGQKLYSGQPRTSHSDGAIARSMAAFKLASQSNNRGLLAEASRLVAHTLNAGEQYEESLEYYRKAVTLFESVGAAEQASRSRLGFTAALYMAGNYKEALSNAMIAERWFQANDHQSSLAKIYGNLGNLYYRRDQHDIALQYHRKARALFEQLQDRQGLAMTYLNLANCFSLADQLLEAEKMYNMCEELSTSLAMQELLMQACYNKSYLMFLQGRSSEALHSFRAVRERFSRSGSRHHMSLCDLDVSEIYLHQLQPVEALSHARQAVEGFSKRAMRYEQAKALAFSAMGLCLLDRLDEAESAGQSSRQMFEQEANRYWTSIADFCLAYIRFARRDVAHAWALAAQAKHRLTGVELRAGTAGSLNRLESLAPGYMGELLKLTINKRR